MLSKTAMCKEDHYIDFIRDSFTPMHEIEEGLFLGSLVAAKNQDLLRRNGITHVVSLLDTFRNVESHNYLIYHRIEITDSPSSDILRHMPDAISFISDALKKGRILVHCAAGVSRSPSVIIGYIMVKHKFSFEEAKEFVRKKRGCIWPNIGFQHQIASIDLDEYQKYLS